MTLSHKFSKTTLEKCLINIKNKIKSNNKKEEKQSNLKTKFLYSGPNKYGYIRVDVLSPENFFKLINIPETFKGKVLSFEKTKDGKTHVLRKKTIIIHKGYKIRGRNAKYLCFYIHGLTCNICGIKGHHFALERSYNEPPHITHHFNLYALTKENEEILMTVDHVLPVSLGGFKTIGNMQTLCINCNMKKGNFL